MIKIIKLKKTDDNFFVVYKKNNEIFTFNGNAEECLNEITVNLKGKNNER
jgi:hypothetical protein